MSYGRNAITLFYLKLMKKNKKNVNGKKYSKSIAQPRREVVKKPEFKLTEDSIVVITTFETGRFKSFGFDSTKSRAERKAIQRENLVKMKASWMLYEEKSKRYTSYDGESWRLLGPKEEPKHYFSARNNHVDASYFEVSQTRRLQGKYCLSFIEEDNKPYNVKREIWDSLNKEQKFMCHVALIAEGKDFKVEIIN